MAQGKSTKMKLFMHPKIYGDAEDCDVRVNLKDIPDAKEGDIIVVYDPELDDVQARLLLQIPHDQEKNIENISIEQSIANTFNLKAYHDVIVEKIVDRKKVAIELLEIIFKDQYFGRSDMWRLKKNLVNKVMYVNKKIEFLKGSMRCQVYEMWSQGAKVLSGVVNEDTKVVFRSYTCQCYLFIQMSSEMWQPDLYGDLYFERAVNGFLKDLFVRWGKSREEGSNHDVTIVLFSRTYYKANSIEEFPRDMRACLAQDYQGRFYEDFYRVAVQNERIEDWTPILTHLRNLFYHYLSDVLSYHSGLGASIPEAYNSNAAQGNFLEVLNISLNVFEKHYLDRSFDRTGQMSVVITPGVGVFEVDRELTNITNQRIIDNGVGSDLVCVGEQPLHAVPLLKFHKKQGSTTNDYSMPNTWINLSFYRSNKRSAYGKFVPLMKNPLLKPHGDRPTVHLASSKAWIEAGNLLNTVYDHDAYDAQVYKLPPSQNNLNSRTLQRIPARKKTTSQCTPSIPAARSGFARKLSDSDVYRSAESISGSLGELALSSSGQLGKSPAINIPPHLADHKFSNSFNGLNLEGPRLPHSTDADEGSPSLFTKTVSSGANSPSEAGLLSSRRAPLVQRRSLINPFDPSHMTIKRTSYRRRWIHIFPKGPSGVLIQPHYYQSSPTNLFDEEEGALSQAMSVDKPCKDRPDIVRSSSDLSKPAEPQNRKQATLLWGATGEQEWNAGIKTDVDWKSLTLPACFPLTTDYFPDNLSLSTAYVVVSEYTLLPEELSKLTSGRKSFQHDDLINELVSQRLGQGCQLITDCDNKQKVKKGQGLLVPKSDSTLMAPEYKLSIGRVFHKLIWKDKTIGVTVYTPRFPYESMKRRYKYRFRSPYLNNYDLSWAVFKTEELETYKWNYVDNYVLMKGEECSLIESLKFWRVRLMIVPDSHRHLVKKLSDSPAGTCCDVYYKLGHEEQKNAVEAFVKLFEVMHRIKRPGHSLKTSRTHGAAMRERLGSNKMDKARHRSGNKERTRLESGSNKEDSVIKDLEDDPKIEKDLKRLTRETSLIEIIEAMRDPVNGVPLIVPRRGLSPNTFISSDAIYWVIRRFDDIHSEETAISFLQELLINNSIRHASGERHIYYTHGFYLYFFVTGNPEEYRASNSSFASEWHEVKVEPLDKKKQRPSTASTNSLLPPCPPFLWSELPKPEEEPTLCPTFTHVQAHFKTEIMEMDVHDKSDRNEWGEIKYHKMFSPLEGYEMVCQWMCASGTLANDLITTWHRKALNLGLHLFPMPSDPFALPLSYKSDPLRSPIVIPLNVDCLKDGKDCLFEEFESPTRPYRLWIFMKFILEQFGFMPFKTEVDGDVQSQFVHVTGNMFVLIASDEISIQSERRKGSIGLPCVQEPKFLWTFNYMLSKKWKSQISGHEALGERILVDFEEFCANNKSRLRDYWDSLIIPIPNPPVGPCYPEDCS